MMLVTSMISYAQLFEERKKGKKEKDAKFRLATCEARVLQGEVDKPASSNEKRCV